MKRSVILLFMFVMAFAQGEQYEMNLNLGNSDTANYTIVTGDCLWDLAKQYYQNPYEWRYIWEHNKYIEDPHWIYPGNKLIIPERNGSVASSDNVQLYDTSKTLNQISDDAKKTPTRQQLSMLEKFKYYFSVQALRQAPFIHKFKSDENKIDVFAYGEVIDGQEPYLIQHKDVQVKLETDDVKIGDRFDFLEIRNVPVKNVKGTVVEPVATGVVKLIDGKNVMVTIDKIWGSASIGAKIVPVRQYKSLGDNLTYSSLSDSLNVGVIARMSPDVSIKISEIFFVDKGANNGISIGDHFIFYQTVKRNKMPINEIIAEGLVIAVENSTATVRLTGAREYSSSNTLKGVRLGKIVAK